MILPKRLRAFKRQHEDLVNRYEASLPVGREHALKAEHFCSRLGIPYWIGTGKATKRNGAGRMMRDLALIAIADGICVAGDNHGYYIPDSRAELEASLRTAEAALKTKQRRIVALRAAADELFA